MRSFLKFILILFDRYLDEVVERSIYEFLNFMIVEFENSDVHVMSKIVNLLRIFSVLQGEPKP